MQDGNDFQLSVEAAQTYEAQFVPALFGAWAPHVVGAAGVVPGRSVLDVGCGTGVVAREAWARTGGRARIVGVDVNEGMLAVARRVAPQLEWRQADAVALPFPDASFDAVVCQATLMFVPSPERALAEMARVVAPAGVVVLQVWDELDAQSGWPDFYEVVRRRAGPESDGLVTAYWRLGDLDGLSSACSAAGLRVEATQTLTEPALFGSVEDFVATEVGGTPLGERLPGPTYAGILDEARTVLAPWRTPGGRLELPIRGHVVTARPSDDGRRPTPPSPASERPG